MPLRPSVIFDTSGWNQLLKGSQSSSMICGLKSNFFVRVSATSISELAATPKKELRKSLLSLCGRVGQDFLYPPHWITNLLIDSFEQKRSSFDWWNVPVEWPELQEKMANLEFFDEELARAQCTDLQGKEREFRDLYSLGRMPIAQAFMENGEGRPSGFREYLGMIPGELLKKGQSFYGAAVGRQTSERLVKEFMAVCPPFRALVHMAYVPEYEYWIRSLRTGESYRAGASDLFSAVYLSYCNRFVTHDERQLNGLKLVLAESDLKDVEVLSYREFREMILMPCGSLR